MRLNEREKKVWEYYEMFHDNAEDIARISKEPEEFVRATLGKVNKQSRWKGKDLIGLYELTFNNGALQYQFKIIGRDADGDYVVQYFSAWGGSPSNLGRMSKDELYDQDKTKLYPDLLTWHAKYREACRRSDLSR
jgi:hypothetical protein